MDLSKFNITILSDPDRERLVAHVDYEKVQFVEISEEIPGEFIIQFYSHPNKEYWEFSYPEIMQALEKAKKRLEAMGPDSTYTERD